MQPDLFTVVAQVVNFLVLVALLRRFLYGPVIRAMNARERGVAEKLEEAAASKRDAAAEVERLRAANAELEGAREELLAEAREQAEARRRQLLADAREEAERQRNRWREAIEREKETLLEELERRMIERVEAIARKALRELADEELERAIGRAFVRRLEALDPSEWSRARERAEDQPPEAFLVTSAFPLPTELRAAIEARVHAAAGDDATVRYDEQPDVVAGVELRTHGLRVAWSLGDFVGSLGDLLAVEEHAPEGAAP